MDHKVDPWIGLPLWIPLVVRGRGGLHADRLHEGARAGLRTRSLQDTIRDTAAWLAQRDNAGAWKDVLSADREREILDAAR